MVLSIHIDFEGLPWFKLAKFPVITATGSSYLNTFYQAFNTFNNYRV